MIRTELAHPWPVGTLYYHSDFPKGSVLRLDCVLNGDHAYESTLIAVPEDSNNYDHVGRKYNLSIKSRMRLLQDPNPYTDGDWV